MGTSALYVYQVNISTTTIKQNYHHEYQAPRIYTTTDT